MGVPGAEVEMNLNSPPVLELAATVVVGGTEVVVAGLVFTAVVVVAGFVAAEVVVIAAAEVVTAG